MQYLKKHGLVLVYLLIVLLVFLGIADYSGTKYLPLILVHLASFGLAYAVFMKYVPRLSGAGAGPGGKLRIPEKWLGLSLYLMLAFVAAFVVLHMVLLGKVPLYDAYVSLDYYYIAYIRQSIKDIDNVFVRYTGAFLIKAILPFMLLLTYLKNKKLFWILLPLAAFYALALIQKSYIVGIFVPMLAYTLASKKFKIAVTILLVIVFSEFLLVFITNPTMRASDEEITREMALHPHNYPLMTSEGKVDDEADSTQTEESAPPENRNPVFVAAHGLYERVFLTTGKVAAYWFEKIPAELPYAHGCGYRFMAPALGCNYADYEYDRIIYDQMYRNEASMGFTGTVTAVHFVYDYANFGIWGMIYSGIFLAFILALINQIFKNDFLWLISLNLLPVLWLSSASLTSTMFSGGWGPTLLLFILYKPLIYSQNRH